MYTYIYTYISPANITQHYLAVHRSIYSHIFLAQLSLTISVLRGERPKKKQKTIKIFTDYIYI